MKDKTIFFFVEYMLGLFSGFLVVQKFSSADNDKIHFTKKSNKVKQRSRYTN